MLKDHVNSLGGMIYPASSILANYHHLIFKNIEFGNKEYGIGRIVSGNAENRKGNRLLRKFIYMVCLRMVRAR